MQINVNDVTCLRVTDLEKANSEYSKLVETTASSDKKLFNLGWKIDELSRLNTTGRFIVVELQQFLDVLEENDSDEKD